MKKIQSVRGTHDLVGKDLPLEKLYLPTTINQIKTKDIVKTLIERLRKKIKI